LRIFATILLLFAIVLVAVPALAGSIGVEYTVNNESFVDLKNIDFEDVDTTNISAQTNQQVRAFGDIDVKNFYFGFDASFLSPQLLNFNDMFDYWLGYAYGGLYLYNDEDLDVYLQLTARESSDLVQGYEDIFGTLGGTVGIRWEF